MALRCSDLPGAVPTLSCVILTTAPASSMFPISQTRKLRLRQGNCSSHTSVQSQDPSVSVAPSVNPGASRGHTRPLSGLVSSLLCVLRVPQPSRVLCADMVRAAAGEGLRVPCWLPAATTSCESIFLLGQVGINMRQHPPCV